MKQSEIKELCKQYIAGAVSDAHLLSKLQVDEDVKTLLRGVTALPMSAQLRIRIEDLSADDAPKRKTPKKAQPPGENVGSAYMQRLRRFAELHFEDDDEIIPKWFDPVITIRVVSPATLGGPAVFYTFAFNNRAEGELWARALVEEIKDHTNSEDDAPDPIMDVNFGIDTTLLTIDEPALRWVDLAPPKTEVIYEEA